ncbi:peroxiredoxin [Ferviditalea candida]|uniref:Peroxiredoxin n=1 Tax=Ferviditalea candida TaxID=3108399 RepID=A0ABU5ZEA9_9BACL|nr:peroxiredoxin [Paenibacillaceae bacterium T2]
MSLSTETRFPTIGDPFPEITVDTTAGKLSLPHAFKGKWFILFSHPGDFTPVCTTEFVSFQRFIGNFQQMNVELIGLSVDQVFSHIKWLEWIKANLRVDISFPIIADPLGVTANKLGMIHPGAGTRTVRAVFIVDDKGIIRLILLYPAEVGRNIHEILRAVHALQTASQYNVATPANWPDNEIIGSGVILPPPESVHSAIERLEKAKAGQWSCLDWWFCYKNDR